MRVAELFYSLQGEGKLIGVPSVFVRASGCNLRCTWCDTPYASWNPEGDQQSVEQIVAKVTAFDARHAVLTGGEPMIMADIGELSAALRGSGMHVTIETAGTVFKSIDWDLASISPKLSNSTPTQREGGRFAVAHDAQRLRPDVIQQFIDQAVTNRGDFQLKFVVSREQDLAEIDELLAKLTDWRPSDVLLMPEGTNVETLRSRVAWIDEVCKRRGFRFSPRLHVELYGNQRGT